MKMMLVASALILVTLLPGGFAAKELKCEEQCHCTMQNKTLIKEYRAICNETGTQPVKLTNVLFTSLDTTEVFQVYVRVEDNQHVTVTEGFMRAWKEFGSCSLDVWNVKHLEFDTFEHTLDEKDWHHVFAGIGISDSSLDKIPSDIFKGKNRGGLLLVRTAVGIIPPNVFSGAKVMKYLHVEDSNIGLLQGSNEMKPLVVEKNNVVHPISIKDSVIGQIQEGALNVTSSTILEMLLDNLTIGQVESNGIGISGLNLLLRNSRVANMYPDALKVHGTGSITIINNQLILQPGALAHLQCSFNDHHINANEINVQVAAPKILESLTKGLDDNETMTASTTSKRKLTFTELASEKLKTVLHSSCINYNLPEWVTHNPCMLQSNEAPKPEKRSSKVLHIGLYSFIGISLLAIIIVVVLTCILISIRTRRRPRNPVVTPTIIMSELQDPIYEEANPFLFPRTPPPVPSPLMTSCSEKGTLSSDNYSAIWTGDGSCNGNTLRTQRVENDYASMGCGSV